MANQPLHAVGLDIGTSRTRCLIGALDESGVMEIVGVGESESRGLRRGIVVKTDSVVESIRRAVEEAERMSGLDVHLVTTNLSGEHLEGRNTSGIAVITAPHREITAEDISRAVEAACAITHQLPAGWEIVEHLPQEYIIDGQDGITEPIGMTGTRLEARVHLVVGPGAGRQNSLKAVNRAALRVENLMLEQIAAAESSLTEEDKEYGAALVNIGAELIGLAIYQRGAVRHTAVFPVGGTNFTKDIAHGLRVSPPDAEQIKRQFGSVTPYRLSDYERAATIDITPVGGRQTKQLSRQILCDMLQPRAEEILQFVAGEIRKIVGQRQLSSGIILTGGGANLNGIAEVAEQVFDAPTRIGVPDTNLFSGLVGDLQDPSWSVAAGLALASVRSQISEIQHRPDTRGGNAAFSAFFRKLKENFSIL